MKEFVFSELTAGQKAEFSFSELKLDEQNVVENIVRWNNPNQYKNLLYRTHGRSLILQSPNLGASTADDNYAGRFNGLQIIGAGGSKNVADRIIVNKSSGVFLHQGPEIIEPVNAANHANELNEILQMKLIDENGELYFWNRPYAPLRGMDAGEASKRKLMTNLLSGYSDLDFRVPKLAAEGYFPDKKDPTGNPLAFQVYRVPLLERYSGQLIQISKAESSKRCADFTAEFSFLAGTTLKTLHNKKLAYLDGHADNMSLIAAKGGKRALYITDLGSVHDFSGEKHPHSYMAFDLIMLLESYARYWPSFVEHFPLDSDDREKFEELLISSALTGLTAGYFFEEKEGDNPISIKDIFIASEQRIGELHGLISHSDDTQDVVDNLAEYLTSKLPTSISF